MHESVKLPFVYRSAQKRIPARKCVKLIKDFSPRYKPGHFLILLKKPIRQTAYDPPLNTGDGSVCCSIALVLSH